MRIESNFRLVHNPDIKLNQIGLVYKPGFHDEEPEQIWSTAANTMEQAIKFAVTLFSTEGLLANLEEAHIPVGMDMNFIIDAVQTVSVKPVLVIDRTGER